VPGARGDRCPGVGPNAIWQWFFSQKELLVPGPLVPLGPEGPGSDQVKCLYSGRKNFRMRQFLALE
jgi:hypothetical protein